MSKSKKHRRKRQPATREQARGLSVTTDEPTILTIAYYFLPLQQPLSIDGDAMLQMGGHPPIHEEGYEDNYLEIEWVEEHGLMGLRTSCRIHHIPCDGLEWSDVAAKRAAVAAFPISERSGDDPPSPAILTVGDSQHTLLDSDDIASSATTTITVVEVAIRLPDDSPAAVNDGLDEAIATVADLQRAYSVVAGQPMPTLTRSRVPWILPYAIRTATPGETEAQWPTGDDIRYLMTQPPDERQFMPMPSDENPARWTLQELGDALTPLLEGPFRHVYETWRNASVAFQQDDLTVAAILLGVSCEQYIRALLLCLVWEDSMSPKDAATLMYRRNGNTRIVRELLPEIQQRLPVSMHRDDAARTDVMDVLELRNSILHRACEPDHSQVAAAENAWQDFVAWSHDGLIAHFERYSATCEVTDAIHAMNALQLEQLEAVFTSTLRPTQPLRNLENYQIEIDRYLPGNEAKRERRARPNSQGEWVMQSLTYPNGLTRWFGLNESTWLAFLAGQPRDLNAIHIQNLRDIAARTQVEVDEFGHQPTIVTRWLGFVPEPVCDLPHLYSWFTLSPMHRAARYASSPIPFVSPT